MEVYCPRVGQLPDSWAAPGTKGGSPRGPVPQALEQAFVGVEGIEGTEGDDPKLLQSRWEGAQGWSPGFRALVPRTLFGEGVAPGTPPKDGGWGRDTYALPASGPSTPTGLGWRGGSCGQTPLLLPLLLACWAQEGGRGRHCV